MFSSALKSFSSNIGGNYAIAASPRTNSGPWKIFDGKQKSTGNSVSIFVLDRKALEPQSNSLGRTTASSTKRATDEIIERLKKEASSLARLRHPNILHLVEPVEELRNGGFQFATETVTTSLAGLLLERDEQERTSDVGGRSSRHIQKDADGNHKRRELEIDELEIQKGLLQIGKALEFLHDNAGLVHGNLTPEAIFINAKSDWKISGLSYLSPPDNSTRSTPVIPISLSEALKVDPRIPGSVQLNLDWTSPDFVLDSSLNTAADMFSLGLLIIALYNSPHCSPLAANSSISAYKRLFTSSSTIPNASNNFLSSRPIPKALTSYVLPRLITRRPSCRMTAKEFQQSAYFDNILISTIRFLDSLPAKTSNEKAQFLRGLLRVLPSFPKSVLDKKVLPALIEEMKDRELLSLILQNVFHIIELLPSARRPLTEKVMPSLKAIFLQLNNTKVQPERDLAKEAGITVLLEHLKAVTTNCSGRDFKDNILPIVFMAIESPAHSLVDTALKCLSIVLPVLDFSTIKNELFPLIASVFSKTSSLGIKVRGLEAFLTLCGGSLDFPVCNDGLDGIVETTKSSSSVLDKYTMQEKIVPLIRGIKTKEPAVSMVALNVLKRVGEVADGDFVALQVLPILWGMSLGPLLTLQQFQSFITVIKGLSSRVESEQLKRLRDLRTDNAKTKADEDFRSFGGSSAFPYHQGEGDTADIDFERLLKGVNSNGKSHDSADVWNAAPTDATLQSMIVKSKPIAASFSWSTPNSTLANDTMSSIGASRQQTGLTTRTITPDLASYNALTPSTTQYSQALQPQYSLPQPLSSFTQPLQASSNFPQPIQPNPAYSQPLQPQSGSSRSIQTHSSFIQPTSNASIDWSKTTGNPWDFSIPPSTNPPLSSLATVNSSMAKMSMDQMQNSRPPVGASTSSSFSLPPPPGSNTVQSLQQNNQRLGSLSQATTSNPRTTGPGPFESLL